MFAGITSTPRDYAWGSRTAIAELLGREPSGGPEAELWLGAHPAWPSTVTDATPGLAGRRLDDVIAADPATLVGVGRSRLPFLLKVLAADAPLSLQVHPDAEQAREGFAREQERGVPIDADDRNYRDDSPKPELILALSPAFEALAGFRHLSETRLLLAELAGFAEGGDRRAILDLAGQLAEGDPAAAGSTGSSSHVVDEGMPDDGDTVPQHAGSGNALADVVERLLRGSGDVSHLVAAVTAAAVRAPQTSSFAREWRTVRRLADTHPGDPGIVVSLLLNRISLARGQVLALGAGVLHAYLEGVGIELMSASDNVLRGGLTAKHVDVDELLRVVRFEAAAVPRVAPVEPVPGVVVWQPEEGDFLLARVGLGDAAGEHGYAVAGPATAAFDLSGPAEILVLDGGLLVEGALGSVSLARGDACFVSPDERALTFRGSGIAVVATTP